MSYRELPPIQSKKPRTIRDGEGRVWRVRTFPPKPGSMGTAFCGLLFESEQDRRWSSILRAEFPRYSHTQLLHELREAKPVPAGRVVPEDPEPEPRRAIVDGEWQEGA